MKSWTGRAPLCLPLGMEHSHTQQWIHCRKMKTRDKAYFPVTLNWNVDHILQLMYIRNMLLIKETQVLLFLWCPDKQISLWTLWKGHYSWSSDAGYNYFGEPGYFFYWIMIDGHLINTLFDLNIWYLIWTLGIWAQCKHTDLLVGHIPWTPADRLITISVVHCQVPAILKKLVKII